MRDRQLLQEYVERRSEQAFAELVERHVHLVYGTALRLVREQHLAQDISQAVFIELAKKARNIRDGNALGGWLYRTTCCLAANAIRKESRRRQREQEAMNLLHSDRGETAEVVAPWLDEAMQNLNDTEQNAVVLRFFEGKTLHEVGLALAITEDAAQKRISRAVEKLRGYFSRRGITVSSAAIFATLASQSVQAAPAGLASSLAGASLEGVCGAGTGLGTIVETFLMTKAKATLVTAVVIAATGTAVFEAQRASTLGSEVRRLRLQNVQALQQLTDSREASASTASGVVADKKLLTAAEIEARIQNIARRSNWRRYTEWEDFVRSLVPRDIPKALAAVENLAEQQVRDVFRRILLGHWARSDPKAALAYAQSIRGDLTPHWTVCQVLGVWANDDPASARAWVQQLPKGPLRRDALNTIMPASVGENPQATFDLIQSLNAWGTVNTDIIFEAWARVDPAAAIAKARELPLEDRSRKSALSTIVSTWATVDPKAAMAWAEALPAEARQEVLRKALLENVIGSWAASEPKQAMEYVLNLPAGSRREEMFKDVVRTWAHNDPKAAFAWSKSMPENPAAQEATHAALRKLAEISPQEALAASQSLPEGKRSAAIRTVGATLTAGDPNGAIEYASHFAEEADRNSFVLGVADALWQNAPSTAAHLVTGLPDSDMRNSIVHRIVSTWAQTDPMATAAWIETFPEGKLREDTLGELAYKWTRQDPAGVLDWLQSLPKDKAWEGAFGGYIARISDGGTPERAAPLAETISNPAQRNMMIELVARKWIKKDRNAATAWLDQTSLPDDRKSRLLQEW